MKRAFFTILILALSAFSLIFSDDKGFYDLSKFDTPDGPAFDFKIREWDLEFYNLMRGHLLIDCDISILQTTDGNAEFEKDFDMVKYFQNHYIVHPDDDTDYIGYQVVTDILKANPLLSDENYYIDNYDIDIDMLDDLDKLLSVDVDYYTDDGTFKKPIGFDISTKTLDDDFIIDISYDSTGIRGNLVDELNLIVIDALGNLVKAPQVWSHVARYKKVMRPRISVFINDEFIMPRPRFTAAYAAPHAPVSLRGFAHILNPPQINVSISEAVFTHYLLREVYKKAYKGERHGASVDMSFEVSPYVLNGWYATRNLVLADYAAGFTATTRFKLIDKRRFNLFLGVRSGYMYSFTSPVMFNLPMFGELGITAGIFEIYIGAGTVYSGAYNANLIPALEAGLGLNIPVSLHGKIALGVNANLAKGYDTSDIKFIEIYSGNINPYLGYKHSFSYFDPDENGKYKDGYVSVMYEDDEDVINAIKDAKIQYIKLTEQEVKARGNRVKSEPIIVTVEDVKPALRMLNFKAGYDFENKQETDYDDEDVIVYDPNEPYVQR